MEDDDDLKCPYCAKQCIPPTHSFIILSIQMDREFEKEQIGTLFVSIWGGGGVGGPFGPPAQNLVMTSTTFFFALLYIYIFCYL